MTPGELIVVDQAPSPAAREVVARWAQADAVYIEDARIGLAASRNRALAASSRPLLAVTDDDCLPDASWVEAIAAAFRRPPAPQAVTGPILSLGPKPSDGYGVSLRESMTATDYRGRVVPWRTGSGANFAAPVALLRRLGGWDERLGTGSPGLAGEDIELLYRVLRSGGTVRYAPGATIRHAWQSRVRRLETRWSYGHGVGAFCGLRLRRGDVYAAVMIANYARLHTGRLLVATGRRDVGLAHEHTRALAGTLAGLWYGLTVHSGSRGASADR
jgi:GT2 family glycosyltransferase